MSRAAADLRRAARAFPALLTVGFAEVVAYRAEFLVWVLTTNMPLVMLALWHAVAEDGAVGRFDQPKFTAYYLAVLIVRLVTSNWMAWQMSMEVRDGTLSAKLLRPIHPLYAYAADHLSALPMRLLYVSPIIVVLLVTSWNQIAGHDARLALVLGPALVGGWLLMFFSMVLLGTVAFYVDSALGAFELWLAVYAIVSGYLIPLELLPAWARAVTDVLPFRYMLAFPAETLVGLVAPAAAVRQLAIQWVYVVATAAGAIAAWRAGVRRFSAFGG